MKRTIILLSITIILLSAAGAWAGTVELPKTGQTETYGTRDDGALEMGVEWPSPRFTDNGDGTMIDHLTGLVWLKNAGCFGKQMWDGSLGSANTLANGTCGLTDGSSAGDWRLPNIRELESLLNPGQSSPATWLTGQGFTNVQSDYYWSSTSAPPDASLAWFVCTVNGYSGVETKAETQYVWPVRSGTASPAVSLPRTGQTETYGTRDDGALEIGIEWPSSRFTDNGDGTVTDNLTSLVWLKDAHCIPTVSWTSALASANSLASGTCDLTDGSSAGDWRLPNIIELYSLIDHSRSKPALPAGHPFVDVEWEIYWSSTTYALYPDYDAWYVDMSSGYMTWDSKTAFRYVWPVRSGKPVGFCAYTITPPGPRTVNYKTSTFNITVKGTGEKGVVCSAPVITPSDPSWITITPSAWGKNKQTVKVTALANPTSSERPGYVDIADKTFSITQKGTPCTLAVKPASSALFSKTGGQGDINVVAAPDDCTWTAVEDAKATWLHIVSGSPGKGSGTVAYNVDENTGKAARNGKITVTLSTGKAKKVFTVKQGNK